MKYLLAFCNDFELKSALSHPLSEGKVPVGREGGGRMLTPPVVGYGYFLESPIKVAQLDFLGGIPPKFERQLCRRE